MNIFVVLLAITGYTVKLSFFGKFASSQSTALPGDGLYWQNDTEWSVCSEACNNTGIEERNSTCVRQNVTGLPSSAVHCDIENETIVDTRECYTDPCPVIFHIGCWTSLDSPQIDSIEGEGSPVLYGDWNERSHPVERCAIAATDLGFDIFALRNGGECLSSSVAVRKFYLKGPGTRCDGGTGRGRTNMDVYTSDPGTHVGEWTGWTVWSSCEAACAGGNQTRERFCVASDECEGESFQYQSCNEDPCPWADQEPTDVYRWLGCRKYSLPESLENENISVLDGDPTKRAVATVKCARAAYGAAMFSVGNGYCHKSLDYSDEYLTTWPDDICKDGRGSYRSSDFFIYTSEPESQVIDGQWSPWTAYTSCTVACDGGTRNRSRACVNPPPDPTGQDCDGDALEVDNCNVEVCPEDFAYKHIGCWTDTNEHSIESLEGDHALLDLKPAVRLDIIRKCALAAYRLNYKVFALQAGGSCRTDAWAQCNFDKYSPIDCGESEGLGGNLINDVYSLDVSVPDGVLSLDFPECFPEEEEDQKLQVQLKYLKSKKSLTLTEATTVLDQYLDYMADVEHLSSETLINSLGILEEIAAKTIVPVDSDVEEYMLKFARASSDLLDESEKETWIESYNETSKMLLINEVHGINVAKNMNPGDSELVIAENLVIQSTAISIADGDSSVLYGVTLPFSAVPEDLTKANFKPSTVYLPPSVFQSEEYQATDVVLVTSANYKTIGELLPLSMARSNSSGMVNDSAVNSAVTSVRLEPPLTSTLTTEPILVTLTHLHPAKSDEPNVSCVFWDFTANPETNGAWSTKGCGIYSQNATHTVCDCYHLTSFGVLMKVTDFEISAADQFALSIITYVCCAISLLALTVAFGIFVYLDNLSSERTTIHKNLIIAIGFGQIVYLAGIGSIGNEVACTAVAILLHFFYTAAFTWMLNEGLHLYSKVVEVFSNSSKLIYYYVIGWGIPLFIVCISVAIRYDGYGTESFCWLSIEDGLIWAFVGPVLTIIVINFIVMVLVIRIIILSASAIALQAGKENAGHIKAGVKGLMILLPILGVTWLCGLFALNEHLIFMEYLFAIFNSLQGLFIFIFHCVGSSEVRSAFNRKKEQRSLTKDFNTVISTGSKGFNTDTGTTKLGESTASQVQIMLTPADVIETEIERDGDIVIEDDPSDGEDSKQNWKKPLADDRNEQDGYYNSAMEWNMEYDRSSRVASNAVRPVSSGSSQSGGDQVRLVESETTKSDDSSSVSSRPSSMIHYHGRTPSSPARSIPEVI
ncbi:adhesion G protein-coupled receptor B3-like isoform X2 [Ptychodera flava]|uniref:adhesion G protein-coupled receptor B3-like isoform X2 n=1 Tax=Ptychodera flava TaxID=63121 RepID=UPI003969D6DD